MSNNETIDMNQLTQKELLILVNSKVINMNNTLIKLTGDYTNLLVRVSNIENRVKTWSAFIAILSSALTSFAMSFLK